jgi:hypothetical protein
MYGGAIASVHYYCSSPSNATISCSNGTVFSGNSGTMGDDDVWLYAGGSGQFDSSGCTYDSGKVVRTNAGSYDPSTLSDPFTCTSAGC